WLETTFLEPEGMRLPERTVVLWKEMPLGEIDPAMPKVHALNAQGYSCYFGVALRRERKHPEERISKKTGKPYLMKYPRGWRKDSLLVTALWCETDIKDHG